MSKPRSSRGILETAVKVVFLGLLVLIAIALPAFLLLIFFVPVVVWFIWRLMDRTAELERRLAEKEKSGGTEN
ncbi:MAG TPA: hypothetical protein VIW22_02105 [Nitrososphaerales archaeon]